jgi:hypothetical protein
MSVLFKESGFEKTKTVLGSATKLSRKVQGNGTRKPKQVSSRSTGQAVQFLSGHN